MERSPEFKDLYTRLFTIEDISEATGSPFSTLRTWQGKGLVSASTSFTPGKTAGRGTKALYSVYDAMQFMLIARIANDTLSIKAIVECCRSEILDIVLERLSEMADGIYHGIDYNPTDRNNAYERYVFVFEKDGKLYMTQEWREWVNYGGYSFHVIDVIELAARVFSLYAKKMGYTPI